jgi:accessory gene regulator B
MIANDVIGDDERAIYSYHIQVMLESVVGHAILLLIAAMSGHFVEILLFLLSFGILRGSTSGYHCKTSVGCFVLSSLACAFVVLLKDLALRYILYCQGGLIISMIIIFLVGAINHPNMGWSDEELKAARRSSRIKDLILFLLLFILDYLGIEKTYLYCFGMGIVQCSISLVIVNLKGKGGKDDEEEC